MWSLRSAATAFADDDDCQRQDKRYPSTSLLAVFEYRRTDTDIELRNSHALIQLLTRLLCAVQRSSIEVLFYRYTRYCEAPYTHAVFTTLMQYNAKCGFI